MQALHSQTAFALLVLQVKQEAAQPVRRAHTRTALGLKTVTLAGQILSARLGRLPVIVMPDILGMVTVPLAVQGSTSQKQAQEHVQIVWQASMAMRQRQPKKALPAFLVRPTPRRCLLAAMDIQPAFAKMILLGWHHHARRVRPTLGRSQEATKIGLGASAMLDTRRRTMVQISAVSSVQGILLPIQMALQALVLVLPAITAMEIQVQTLSVISARPASTRMR